MGALSDFVDYVKTSFSPSSSPPADNAGGDGGGVCTAPNPDQTNQSVDPNAGQPNQSVDPNAGQPNQSVDPNVSQPNQSVDPNAGQPNQSVDPNASQPNQCVDPNASQPNQSVDPNASQPNQSLDPNAGQPNQSVDPNAGQPNQSVDPNAGQPNQSVDPNASQPNQSVDPNANQPNQCVDPNADQPNQSVPAVPDANAGGGDPEPSDGGLPPGGGGAGGGGGAEGSGSDGAGAGGSGPGDPDGGSGGAEGSGGDHVPEHWQGSRGLSGAERSQAYSVYQDSIDYDQVTIVAGGLGSIGDYSRTIGNSIYLKDDEFDGNTSNLSSSGMNTLIHELGHVWQYQHGGAAYIPNALGAQLGAKIATGDSSNAYKWRDAWKQGLEWKDWNAEQQAEAMEDYYKAKQRIDAGTPNPSDQQTVTILEPYVGKVRSGKGAPGGPSEEPGDYEVPKGDKAPA